MPLLQAEWTVEQVHELPEDGNRYEVIDGVLLVSPSPAPVHQRAVGALYSRLVAYSATLGLEAFFAPAAVTWGPRTELQPDVMVPLIEGRRIEKFAEVSALELSVEVLSPSTARVDRFTKRREYQRRGVSEYWIVDPPGRSVERWRPSDEEPEILYETLVWHPRPDVEPLVVDLAEFFRSIHGE
jgi:Uma2 family endonuclease